MKKILIALLMLVLPSTVLAEEISSSYISVSAEEKHLSKVIGSIIKMSTLSNKGASTALRAAKYQIEHVNLIRERSRKRLGLQALFLKGKTFSFQKRIVNGFLLTNKARGFDTYYLDIMKTIIDADSPAMLNARIDQAAPLS